MPCSSEASLPSNDEQHAGSDEDGIIYESASEAAAEDDVGPVDECFFVHSGKRVYHVAAGQAGRQTVQTACGVFLLDPVLASDVPANAKLCRRKGCVLRRAA